MDFKTFLFLVIGGVLLLALLVWLNAYVAGGNILRFIYGAGLLSTIGIVTIVVGLAGSGWFYQQSQKH